GYLMNSDGLTRSRCRPIRVALRNTIDCLVEDVDKFARSTDWIHTENLGIGILNARTGCSADPVVLSDDSGKIGDWIAVWRSPQGCCSHLWICYRRQFDCR